MEESPRVRIGVRAGEPPGYVWGVEYFVVAREEAHEVLQTEEQYHHIADQFKELALQEDPTHSVLVDVRKLKNEGFYELRDKGGPLGNINFRAFFLLDERDGSKLIVVMGAIKKEEDQKTSMGDIVRMRRRMRDYLGRQRGPEGPKGGKRS